MSVSSGAALPPADDGAAAASPRLSRGEAASVTAIFAVVAVVLVVSGIAPKDRITWVMEVMPVVIAGAVIAATWTRFPLTTLLCVLIALHSLVLIVGGAYTYAHVPFGFWLQDVLHTERNPYDKIGHFMQGFVPAMAEEPW